MRSGDLDGNGQMEVSLLSGGAKHSLETVRVLHETVLALRTALEGSRKELSELRSRFRSHDRALGDSAPMETVDEATGRDGSEGKPEEEEEEEDAFEKPDSGAESEDIDDIELVFTTGETDPGAIHEDMVPIRDERKPQTHEVPVETDISKCGVIDENDAASGCRRNTLPDPLPYRPIIHREILAAARAARGSPRKVRPVVGERTSARQETAAQTDITAVPALWKSETYLAHKISCNLTTLPSKFALPVPRSSLLPLSDKSREARRVLLSDINFTSKVPELSRSADHLHREEDPLHGGYRNRGYMKSCESGWEGKVPETGRNGSRSSWGSRYQASTTSIPEEEPQRRHSCRVPVACCHVRHAWSSVPSFRCHPGHHHVVRADEVCPSGRRAREHHCCPSGRSLPDLRGDCDSGDSTDSLIDEAEEFLRRSIDLMMLPRKKTDRRYSEPESSLGAEPPKSAQPFLPKSPGELKTDCLVKVIAADGRIVMGRVRYSGQVVGKAEPYVGIELHSSTGGSDGTFLDHRYFDCKPDHAIFVPFKKVVLAWCT
ncbi:UNVERIFIED_CONTAM: hypothetical protein PYX00_002772 [Menopon gallinae]|uniref:CAP-Gly domain-containing protein n=1 Tax=Menopon gallinae TaxID=328185 RepID=A0AAW2HYZ9_9NEOP